MSTLEMKKLVIIRDNNFVMPGVSDLRYEELVADQRATNGLIRWSLEESVASQYLRLTKDQDP